MNNGQSFFDTYAKFFENNPEGIRVVEIGSQDVNGTLRDACPNAFDYIGVDFEAAKGVDVILEDPYVFPFESESADIVISSSCFEHSEMFWLVFLEIMRILKPKGLFYLNAPSTGDVHRYPVDCWRFYPDSGMALVNWAKRNGINAAMLESYTQSGGGWDDYVSVFLKDELHISEFTSRIIYIKKDFRDGQLFLNNQILHLNGCS